MFKIDYSEIKREYHRHIDHDCSVDFCSCYRMDGLTKTYYVIDCGYTRPEVYGEDGALIDYEKGGLDDVGKLSEMFVELAKENGYTEGCLDCPCFDFCQAMDDSEQDENAIRWMASELEQFEQEANYNPDEDEFEVFPL